MPTRIVNLRHAMIAMVAFGLVCRLSQYAANTSLWHDEAFVALNVLHKSFGGLLGPLEWHEPAPPGFLVLEKVIVTELGRSEYALRLIPLLAGLAGLIGFAMFAARVCSRIAAAFWAVWLMAAADKLIVQAEEVKHFTLDLLWAVLLSWVALRICRVRPRIGALLVWGALGAIGLWLAFASVFVCAGTGLVLAWLAVREWPWAERGAYMIAILWILGSLALLLVPIQAQMTGSVLGFWAGSFPDMSSVPALLYWLGRSLLGLFNYVWQPLGAALLVLGVLGSVAWWRAGRRDALLLLVLPVLGALVASCVRRWPFGGNQHMVFAAPAVLVLVAEGIEEVRRRLASRAPWVGVIGLALLLSPGLVDAAYRIALPRQRHEVRPVIAFVQRYVEPADQLLVLCPAEFEFYTGRDVRNAAIEPDPAARVWFIATRSGNKPFAGQDLLDRLRTRRRCLRAIEAYGAAAYFFAPEDSRKNEQTRADDHLS